MSFILNLIFSWLYQNNLILNVDILVFITFGNYKDSIPVNVDIILNGHLCLLYTETSSIQKVTITSILWTVP